MYQRIKNSLFFPKQLGQEYQKGVIGFLVFLIVLSSLPFILYTCFNGLLTNSDVRQIKMAFYETPKIEYRIENQQLVCYSEVPTNRYFPLTDNTLGIAFLTNPDEKIVVNEGLVIALEKEGIFLYSTSVANFKYQIANYDKFTDIDFALAKDLNNTTFWNQIFGYVNDIMDDLRMLIYPSYFVSIVIQMAVSVLIGILTNTIIIVLFDRTPGLRFKEVFKNTIVAFFPYVVTVILAYALNFAFLQYVGNVLSFVYAMIAHNEYRKIKYKEYKGHE